MVYQKSNQTCISKSVFWTMGGFKIFGVLVLKDSMVSFVASRLITDPLKSH